MTLLWLPAARRAPINGQPGFAWQVNCPTKGILHTTEGGNGVPSYTPGFKAPHMTVLVRPGTGVDVVQHIPFDRASYSLVHAPGTVATNGAHAIQMELCGTSDPSTRGEYFWPGADDAVLTDLWTKVLQPLDEAFGIKLKAPTFKAYPASYGAHRDLLRLDGDAPSPLASPVDPSERTEDDPGAPEGGLPLLGADGPLGSGNGVRFSERQWLDWDGYCFNRDVLVTTSTGLTPISEIQVGDLVLTAEGRFRPVTVVHRRMAVTGLLAGQGHPGLRTTPEHPFLSVSSTMGRRKVAQDPNRARELVFSTAGWVKAQDLPGSYWATPVAYPLAEPPVVVKIPGKGRRNVPAISPELLRLAGRYVADGSMGGGGKIVITGHRDEAPEITDLFAAAGLPTSHVTHHHLANTRQVTGNSVSLSAWLTEHFGQYAHGKSLPTWLLGCDEKYREAFWEGYIGGDGYIEPQGRFDAKTASKKLAIGLRMLAASLGYGTALYLLPAQFARPFPGGRLCDVKPQWRLKGSKVFGRGTATKRIGDHRYSRVKSFTYDETAEPEEVFNLTVAEDNTYVADGIVVHNCGHQHVPGGNVHGDPGLFPWDRLVALAGQQPPNPPKPPKPPTPHTLVVDGVLGADTIRALQRKVGAPADGQIGPVTWRAVDVWLGVTPPNGVPGRDTIRALQRKVGSAADGILGVNTIRALQRWLNNHR